MTLDQRVQHLRKDLEHTQKLLTELQRVLSMVIGSHNFFVHMTFWHRLRWLLLGAPRPKQQQQENANGQ